MLQEALSTVMDHAKDSVRFYRLCKICQERIDVLGCGPIHSDDDVVIL